MESKKKQRKALRIGFSKCANELEQLLASEAVDKNSVHVGWEVLNQKYASIQSVDQEIYDLMLEQDVSEDDLVQEMENGDVYLKRYTALRLKYNDFNKEMVPTRLVRDSVSNSSENSVSTKSAAKGKRKFKLPIIEFKKFGGNIREWLPFWNQFKKIHDDSSLDPSDKIEYLFQTTLPDSRARLVVQSFPAVNENYEKIISALKDRFGREDLQIEVYVRELLKLILSNASNKRNFDLCMLYDKIETELRALETLGITMEKCSAMLFPLIESCLPEDLLKIWQRSSVSNDRTVYDSSSHFNAEADLLECRSSKKQLERLLQFLRHEVENEQRIALAAEGFGLCSVSDSNKKKIKRTDEVTTSLPTAAALINSEVVKCVLCDGIHGNDNCFKAHKLTLEQKRSILSEKKACFRCMKVGHSANRCRARLRCILCSRPHVIMLCPELPKHSQRQITSKNTPNNPKPANDEQSLANYSRAHVFLPTLRVQMVGKNGSYEVRALIDTGSQRSYILKNTAERLGYFPKRVEKIVHSLFGGTSTNEQSHSCYDVKLNKEGYTCTFEVLDQHMICKNISSIFSGPWIKELQNLNIHICEAGDSTPIELLIGADVAGRLYTGRRHVLECGLVAVETHLGWTVMGKVPSDLRDEDTVMTTISLLIKDASIADLWTLDVLGIQEPSEKRSRDELTQAAKEHFIETIEVNEEGRYQVRLPWLDGHPPLPNNYVLAKKRLDTTVKKLKADSLWETYDEVFNEWIREGIIEEIPNQDDHSQGHYLPHRPVIKNNSTTKVRPVFDASARGKGGPSLNDCLEKGVNLIQLIPSILLKFRAGKFGVVSDIRKAFLQIAVHEAERDYLRFLWTDNAGKERIYRHRRVVFGVCSSPFLLGATIDYHLIESSKKCSTTEASYSLDVIEKLRQSFYVDNCVTSLNNETDLIQFIKEATMLMAEAKFDLRGWEFTRTLAQDESSQIPVLGLNWNSDADVLSINSHNGKICDNFEEEIVTKRLILSVTQKIFDPIGFTCPATLYPKLLLQRAWEKQLGWDVPVDDEMKLAFCKWLKEVPHLFSINLPRWVRIRPDTEQEYTMHTFCDASKEAYAAVVFLRVQEGSTIYVYLLAAKARVAPLKKLSIPRLELLAATIGARLCNTVKQNFDQQMDCYFWSDSSTVISWIRRTDEWSTFVWNRVQEIRTLTSPLTWKHLPGSKNPADLPSRGCFARQLLATRWWEGPEWLYEEPSLWPISKNLESDEVEVNLERKKKLVTTLLNFDINDWHLIHFSKYSKTVNMIAWIFRFANNARREVPKRQGVLTVEEIERSELFIFKLIQTQVFPDIRDHRISVLNPFYDHQGLIRLKSRISNRKDFEDFRFPILLPSKHLVVHSLILYYHERSCHVGTQGLCGTSILEVGR